MPKTAAERTRAYQIRKRLHAREAGLCYTCYKQKPNPGLITCASCNTAALERQRRKREKLREAAKSQQVIALQESAGDEASKYHLYFDAIHYYQEALNVPAIALTDRERIVEKIGEAFFLNGDFKLANLWCERLLTMYRANPREATKSIETLFQLHRQLTLDCKGEAMSATMMRAVQIAENSGDTRLVKLVHLRRLEASSYFDEAAEALREVGRIGENNDASLRGYYLVAQAAVAGAVGDAEKAYENFELAIELTKKALEPHHVARIWVRYGDVARELGDSQRAKACFEQALFVAQRYRITWMIALLSLHYAQLLAYMGQSATAYSYLLEALSLSPSVPFLDIHRASVGIPLALQVQDERVVAQCAHPRTIKFAFEAEMSGHIGPVASAFAKFYASKGRPRAALALLHRALEKISNTRFNLDMLLTTAQHGAPADLPRARALIQARTILPRAAVFQAGLALFDAFTEQRRGALAQARTHARNAAARFDALQLYGYAELAHAIVPDTQVTTRQKAVDRTPFSHMPTLTGREREVAALVLRGLTNREIANELTIALHTVEKHMNSIMNRLGVRSRYQVAGVLESTSN